MTRKKGKGIKEKNKTPTTKKGATPLLGFTSAESSPKVPHSRDLLIQLGSSKRGIPGAWNRAGVNLVLGPLSYTAVFVLLVKEKSLFKNIKLVLWESEYAPA
jgi:hypothetical protein